MASSTKDDALMKQFWQTYKFSLQDTSTSTREINQSIREKVDKLRSLLFFLRKLLACKKINETSFEILHKDLSLQYHSLVGSMDKDNGLDNYSDMMKALSDSKRNESRGWVSELSLEENRQPLCVKDLQRIEKKEPRNMKICFSKKHLHIQERSSEPSKKVEAKNIANTQHLQHSQHLQHFSQDSSRISSSNATSVPVFGKRKHNSFNGGYKDEMKKHLKTTSYFSSENNTGMKTSINGRSKAIIYGRETAFNSSSDDASSEKLQSENPFLTARDQLRVDMKKSGKALSYGQKKKCLGARGGVNGRFIPPIGQEKSERKQVYGEKKSDTPLDSKYEEFEWMKNIDPKMVELIENEVMDHGPQVSWDDIAGLEFAKTTIQEIVIWPMLRPDIFTGLRGPPKGLLLFGPPGTGKTLIGKCIASQSNAKFFNISASSLTSKWVGDGEKMVRALFGVARCEQPAVIFIDEIDSLLTQRSESEHESSRRIKTEFLVQLDGATASSDDRLLVVGATNRPQELDEAARRRLVKRLYIPLPDAGARKHIVNNLMSNQGNDLHEKDMDDITSKTNGFSGADMTNLCREAALGPIRNIADIRNINADEVRPINVTDFQNALKHVRPSVSQNDLQIYVNWNNLYGSGGVS